MREMRIVVMLWGVGCEHAAMSDGRRHARCRDRAYPWEELSSSTVSRPHQQTERDSHGTIDNDDVQQAADNQGTAQLSVRFHPAVSSCAVTTYTKYMLPVHTRLSILTSTKPENLTVAYQQRGDSQA